MILKATKVDGIYDKDPMKHADARKFDEVTYIEALQRGLKVMDSTAISMCMDNAIPIIVFELVAGAIAAVVRGEKIGTRVTAVDG